MKTCKMGGGYGLNDSKVLFEKRVGMYINYNLSQVCVLKC